MWWKTILLVCLLKNSKGASAARILAAIQTASYSHQTFFQPIWQELASRGHQVVVLTTHPTNNINGTQLTEINLSTGKFDADLMKVINENDFKLAQLMNFVKWYTDMATDQLNIPEVKTLIANESEHFDLAIIEYIYPAYLAFGHRFKCPVIGIASLNAPELAHEAMGNPIHPLLYPDYLLPYSFSMTFIERLRSFIFSCVYPMITLKIQWEADKQVREHFGNDYPKIAELQQNIDMLFINVNPLFTTVRPMSPGTININGGLHLTPPQKLPDDIQKFLDSNANVIYFSLGSNVKGKHLPESSKNVILKTFQELPFKILMKFDDDSFGNSTNILVVNWVPQQDVLRHKNVKLFISQGGLQSLEESLHAHVPVVALPIFGDQEGNARKLEDLSMGLMLDYRTLSKESFKRAILEVMLKDKYRKAVKKLSKRIKDEPMKHLEKALWWIEYVLRHRDVKYLQGAKIPFYQYYYLDIFGFLLLIAVLTKCIGSFTVGFIKLITRKIYKLKRS